MQLVAPAQRPFLFPPRTGVSKTACRIWPHSWFSAETPECNLTFLTCQHTLPSGAACSADIWSSWALVSRPSGCSLQHLTSFLYSDQRNNLSVWSFCLQMLGTCLPVHMSAWIMSEAMSGRRGVAAFVSFRKIEGNRLFVSLSQRLFVNPARSSESSHFFFCAHMWFTKGQLEVRIPKPRLLHTLHFINIFGLFCI